MVRQWNLSNHFASNTQKILPRSYFCWRHAIKNSRGQMRQISRRMEMIHPTIGWRRDENGTHKHAHGSWILWFISRVCSKTMHSLSYITSWLPYISLCYIDSRFFLPLEQSHTALLGCRLAASQSCSLAISRWRHFSCWNKTDWVKCHFLLSFRLVTICMQILDLLQVDLTRTFFLSLCKYLQQKSYSINSWDNLIFFIKIFNEVTWNILLIKC